jgi:alkanesulfonate monooxygenase SsuD/methylene tetrahydromethanopterin reductase-like flavin-dependent oxidoreductase (luciferase family)
MTAFGFLLPTREIVMNQEVPNFRQILDLAEHAEALGFDSVWVGDSVLARSCVCQKRGTTLQLLPEGKD